MTTSRAERRHNEPRELRARAALRTRAAARTGLQRLAGVALRPTLEVQAGRDAALDASLQALRISIDAVSQLAVDIDQGVKVVDRRISELAREVEVRLEQSGQITSSSLDDIPALCSRLIELRAGRDSDGLVVPGHCPVCGHWTFFSSRGGHRESLVCVQCYSTSRYRRVALGILGAIRELTGVEASSIAELPDESPTRIRLLDTQRGFSSPPYAAYELPNTLDDRPWIEVHTSSYRPDMPWGASLGGTSTNQNLEHLTFDDGFFDLLITSDVMEHVRLYELAHAEIARVVRHGGIYLFTVPHSRDLDENLVRVKIHDPGDASTDEHVLPPEYHGSANSEEGPVLSYRVFGVNIDVELTSLGFDVEYSRAPFRRHAIFETELFVCRRR